MNKREIVIGLTCSQRSPGEMTNSNRQNIAHYRAVLRDAGVRAKVLFTPAANSSQADLHDLAQQYNDELAGLIVTGGADLPPAMYGAKADPHLGELIPTKRPLLEKELLKIMLDADKAILGICYGVQMLNVVEGGTLFQDIPSHFSNALEHTGGARHDVHTEAGTRLREWLGERFEVASYHHQSVDRVAPSAQLAAVAPDGIIEAVEFPKYRFCLGVQWHPERTRETAASQMLIQKFVDACQ